MEQGVPLRHRHQRVVVLRVHRVVVHRRLLLLLEELAEVEFLLLVGVVALHQIWMVKVRMVVALIHRQNHRRIRCLMRHGLLRHEGFLLHCFQVHCHPKSVMDWTWGLEVVVQELAQGLVLEQQRS